VNFALQSARGFVAHLNAGSDSASLDVGFIVLSLAGIILFSFCLVAQYCDEMPVLQPGDMERPVKTVAASACWTGPDPSPRESLECSHDLVSVSRSPLTGRLQSTVSVKSVPQSALQTAFDASSSSPGTLVAPPELGQRLASRLDVSQSVPCALCAGLVVPDGCECTLLLPRVKPTFATGEATVNDLANIPVFSVVFCQPAFPSGVPTNTSRENTGSLALDCDGDRCLALYSSSDDGTLLAYCRANLNNTLGILDADDAPFGLVRMRTGRFAGGFEVITEAGSDLHLAENKFGEVIISDRHGQTLALTEPHPPEPEFRLFRVGPNCDAGLATLCVLVIDLLKATFDAGKGFPGKGRPSMKGVSKGQ